MHLLQQRRIFSLLATADFSLHVFSVRDYCYGFRLTFMTFLKAFELTTRVQWYPKIVGHVKLIPKNLKSGQGTI